MANGCQEIENEEEGKREAMKLLNLSSRQKSTLINGAIANIILSVCYTLVMPFLQDVAVNKDVSLTGAGAILGCYEVAMFCCSLIIGSQLSRIGTRRCSYIGGLVIGVSSLAFGFLDACPLGDTFLGLAITIRVMESFGASMSFAANYALATKEFRDNVATAYGFLEMCAGLGNVLGPLVGGGLYQLGGFGLPFFVSGPLMIITAAVAFFTLPTEIEEQDTPTDYGQLIKISKIPAIPLEQLAVWVGYVGLSALSPTLGGHLQNVGSSVEGNHMMIGLAFSLTGAFYTCSVLLFGFITDKYNQCKVMIILGLIVMAVALTLIGPWVPLNHLFPNGKGASWGVFLGRCLCGIGTACINVAVLADCVNEAVFHGLPDNIITYGNLSAVFDTSMGLGNFIGTLIGAAIVEHNPFSTLSAVLTGLCLGEAGLLVLYCAVVYAVLTRRRNRSEYSSIDSDNASNSDTQNAEETLLLPPTPCPIIQSQYVQPEKCMPNDDASSN